MWPMCPVKRKNGVSRPGFQSSGCKVKIPGDFRAGNILRCEWKTRNSGTVRARTLELNKQILVDTPRKHTCLKNDPSLDSVDWCKSMVLFTTIHPALETYVDPMRCKNSTQFWIEIVQRPCWKYWDQFFYFPNCSLFFDIENQGILKPGRS